MDQDTPKAFKKIESLAIAEDILYLFCYIAGDYDS